MKRRIWTLALVGGLLALAATAGATQQAVRTKAQWQAAIARVPQPGRGCYQASYPALRWHAVKCVTAPHVPFAPATRRKGSTVGDGNDHSAQVSGLISKAIGTFTDVSSNITEKGKIDNEGSKVANAFSLQLNSQFFTDPPACAGSSDPADCLGWQQFVYAYSGCSGGGTPNCIFMQYWLIYYDAPCPSGWFTYANGGTIDCYTNSAAAPVNTVTAKDLATVKLTGSAKSKGNDAVSVSVGSGKATSVSNSDHKLHLASYWKDAEWGVFGDAGGGEAFFGTNNTLEAQTALTTTSSSATCVKAGYTGETNNLNFTHTPALGSKPSPTVATRQTDGTTHKPSCATAP
jgi:hypothetical protein